MLSYFSPIRKQRFLFGWKYRLKIRTCSFVFLTSCFFMAPTCWLISCFLVEKLKKKTAAKERGQQQKKEENSGVATLSAAKPCPVTTAPPLFYIYCETSGWGRWFDVVAASRLLVLLVPVSNQVALQFSSTYSRLLHDSNIKKDSPLCVHLW